MTLTIQTNTTKHIIHTNLSNGKVWFWQDDIIRLLGLNSAYTPVKPNGVISLANGNFLSRNEVVFLLMRVSLEYHSLAIEYLRAIDQYISSVEQK